MKALSIQQPHPRRHIPLLKFIAKYIKKHGFAPCIDEMADALGTRYATTREVFYDLRTYGYLIIFPHYPRLTQLTRRGKFALSPQRKKR